MSEVLISSATMGESAVTLTDSGAEVYSEAVKLSINREGLPITL